MQTRKAEVPLAAPVGGTDWHLVVYCLQNGAMNSGDRQRNRQRRL
jgi:hypothetical protein